MSPCFQWVSSFSRIHVIEHAINPLFRNNKLLSQYHAAKAGSRYLSLESVARVVPVSWRWVDGCTKKTKKHVVPLFWNQYHSELSFTLFEGKMRAICCKINGVACQTHLKNKGTPSPCFHLATSPCF